MDAMPAQVDPWRAWLHEWGTRLLLYARHQTPSEADAQDALQEGLVRLWRQATTPTGVPPGMVFRLVRQAAIDHARQRQRRERREQAAAGSTVEPFICPVEPDERRQALQAAVSRLPHDQREVLTLKIWGELTFDQIAQALDIPPATAASRYRYALDHLRRLLPPTLA